MYPRLAAQLPWRERLLGLLHGMYYLRSTATLLGLIALISLLLTGSLPELASGVLVANATPVVAMLALANAYRQRFYLGGRQEWGFHWRASVLEFAKWPYMLLALSDVLIGSKWPYILTRKIGATARRSSPHLLLAVHGLTSATTTTAWILGNLVWRVPLSAVHLVATCVLVVSVGIIVSQGLSYPEPYNSSLPRS